MRKVPVYALVTIGLLLLVVSCQSETGSQEPTMVAVSGPKSTEPTVAPTTTTQERETPAQRPADSKLSASGLRARLEIPSSLTLGQPVKVQFSLINESGSDLYILNWFTPLEGLGGDIFRVTRDGQRVRYQGPLASRSDPTPEAYTLLEAGEVAVAEVDLSLAYDFSISGEYTIEFLPPKLSHIAYSETDMARSMDELRPVEIRSNQVVVTIGAGR